MARILVISPSDLGSDPRVDRQIDALRGEHDIVAAGYTAARFPDVAFIELERPRQRVLSRIWTQALRVTRRYDAAYWSHPSHRSWCQALQGVRPDLVVANDVMALPLAVRIALTAPVIFDAHEYAPAEHATSPVWRAVVRPFIEAICRRHVPEAAAMTTVSQGIATLYAELTGVRPRVVVNAPDYQCLEPSEVDTERIRLVHWGLADPIRRPELMLEAMSALDDRHTLDLVLVGDPDYIATLRAAAAPDPRIRFLPPVAMHQLPSFGNQYDIGVFVLPPQQDNQRFVLPNKFFEYVQARLAVAIGPSPEMERLATQYGFGIVAADFTAAGLAAAIGSVSPTEVALLKQRAHDASRDLSAEHTKRAVRQLVRSVLNDAR